MSTHRNRARLSKSECGRDYHLISLNEWYPLYWDEGLNFYPYYKRGYKNPNKRIPMYKVREYKTWKYNRKTQWNQFTKKLEIWDKSLLKEKKII